MKYDGFISYSHATDGRLAPALQVGLEKFAKPLWKKRALHVFRDDTDLSANPQLWETIVNNLSESSWLLLMASPDAAKSKWVARELDWWLSHRSPDTLLIILTAGELVWDEPARDFDLTHTTAIPSILTSKLTNEPLFVDLRWARKEPQLTLRHTQFRSSVLSISATLRGLPKDELDGIAVRTHRRILATAWAAIALLCSALSIAGWQWREAATQRDLAIKQSTVAQSRLLAAQSEQIMHSKPGAVETAALLAVEALRLSLEAPANDTLRKALVLLSPTVWRPRHSKVLAETVSPDGELVATLEPGGVLLITETETGHERLRTNLAFPINSFRNERLRFSRDRRHVFASKGVDTAVIDLASGQRADWLRANFEEQPRGWWTNKTDFSNLVFSADGRFLAAWTSYQSVIEIWETAKAKQLLRVSVSLFRNETTTFRGAVDFSPDEKYCAIGNYDEVIVFDLEREREITRLKVEDRPISRIAFSSNHKVAAAVNANVWRFSHDGRGRAQVLRHDGEVSEITFSPHGDLATVTEGGVLRLWDYYGVEITSIGRFYRPRFVRDGRWLAADPLDGGPIAVWEVFAPRPIVRANISTDRAVWSVSFNPQGNQLAYSHEYYGLAILDLNTGKVVKEIDNLCWDSSGEARISVSFTSDGQRLSGNCSGRRYLIDVATARKLEVLDDRPATAAEKGGESVIERVSTSDGRFIAETRREPGGKYSLRLARAGSADPGVVIFSSVYLEPPVFVGDGTLVAVADLDGRVRIFRVPAGEELAATTMLTRPTYMFSPDRRRLAIESNPNDVIIWDLISVRPIAHLVHNGRIKVFAWSRDGSHIATAGTVDGYVRVWEAETGRLVGQEIHSDRIDAIEFGGDGRYIAATGWGRDRGRVWLWNPDDLARIACSRLTRNLTQSEWSVYLPFHPYQKSCPDLP